jgi:hypothetical protein
VDSNKLIGILFGLQMLVATGVSVTKDRGHLGDVQEPADHQPEERLEPETHVARQVHHEGRPPVEEQQEQVEIFVGRIRILPA